MSDYEVGYKKPPKWGRIRKGERRNPEGRPRKKSVPAPPQESIKDIMEKIENELIDFQGTKITKMEARIRVLHTLALKGEPRAIKLFEDLRKEAGVGQKANGGGVLVVPGILDEETWSAMARVQQAPFREEDADLIQEP